MDPVVARFVGSITKVPVPVAADGVGGHLLRPGQHDRRNEARDLAADFSVRERDAVGIEVELTGAKLIELRRRQGGVRCGDPDPAAGRGFRQREQDWTVDSRRAAMDVRRIRDHARDGHPGRDPPCCRIEDQPAGAGCDGHGRRHFLGR